MRVHDFDAVSYELDEYRVASFRSSWKECTVFEFPETLLPNRVVD